MMGDKMHKASRVLAATTADEAYLKLVSHWVDPMKLVLGTQEPEPTLSLGPDHWVPDHVTERMMYMDLVTYLPDDILVKVDRATMSVGLEARVPMLDPDVVAFAWSLPLELRVGAGQGKRLLREVLARYVPRHLTDRPKTGFGVPIGEWLRGPLREWAEDLLEESRMREAGYLDPQPIREAWAMHVERSAERAYELWDVLMFQAWLNASRESASTSEVTARC